MGKKSTRLSNLLGYVIERVGFVMYRLLICLQSITLRYFIGQNVVAGRLFAGRTP